MRNCWRWWRTVWKGVNRDTEQWWRGVLWEWANCVGTYLKGRTGDILWREEPCKAISSNAIKGQDYLGNGIRNTKFCYRCRTEAPRPATGETGIWLWPLDRPHVWGQLLFCLRVCVCVCVTASSYSHQLDKRVLWVFMGVPLQAQLALLWLVVPHSVWHVYTCTSVCRCTYTSGMHAVLATGWASKWEQQQTGWEEKSPGLESPLD